MAFAVVRSYRRRYDLPTFARLTKLSALSSILSRIAVPRHVNIRFRSGSVELYYHFLLGFFLPFATYLSETPSRGPFILRSCGPMDRILRELAMPGLLILDHGAHVIVRKLYPQFGRVQLDGYDMASYEQPVDPQALGKGTSFVRDRWRERIAAYSDAIGEAQPLRPRVLVIERGEDVSSASQPARQTMSGRRRRSIGNHQDLVAALTARFPGTRNAILDGCPLAEQIALFRTADLVIAQHGAALSNIVWMLPEVPVIEIVPAASMQQQYVALFPYLAETLGLRHTAVLQQDNFSAVDTDEVVAAAEAALEQVSRPALS